MSDDANGLDIGMAERDQAGAVIRDDADLAAFFYGRLRSQGVPRNGAAHITGVYIQTRLMQQSPGEEEE